MRVIIDASGQEAEPVIEPVGIGAARLVNSQMPLAGHIGPVPLLFQGFGHGGHVLRQSGGGAVSGQNGPDSGPGRIPSGQQRRPGRTAHRAVRIEVAEATPAGGQPVEIRSAEIGRPHARQIPIPLVVGDEDHEIRLSHNYPPVYGLLNVAIFAAASAAASLTCSASFSSSSRVCSPSTVMPIAPAKASPEKTGAAIRQ